MGLNPYKYQRLTNRKQEIFKLCLVMGWYRTRSQSHPLRRAMAPATLPTRMLIPPAIWDEIAMEQASGNLRL
ncbi:hypothetical protein PAXINDRAFT_168780 [Paxillus involutus ATCC 200175]|uniref:Uncharacterized protein n=1 Tax=Paxillus involutus ATCC 200175 TaxID=664439 RepID=A0A0C9U9V9_PAXIN|nr:hypothetical protein PAXINDRAFT_168780 [Paxillus involutus ATCC 200175]